MIENLVELVAAVGLNSLGELRPWHIQRRVNGVETRSYAELYPRLPRGCLRSDSGIPEDWQNDWKLAESNSW